MTSEEIPVSHTLSVSSSGNINNEPSASGDSDTTRKEIQPFAEKVLLKMKLQEILCCGVCSELRRSAMYQCKYGHLICAGCFGDILAESRTQNEISSCPTCQSVISKDLSARNVAVEKTISALPMVCQYCFLEFPPDVHKNHETQLCEYRPAVCYNRIIGCQWIGSFNEKIKHEENCKQLLADGLDILKSLSVIDQQQNEEKALYEKIIELLSIEKIIYNDLQLRPTECNGKSSVYETLSFSVLEYQFLVRVRCQKNSSGACEICYQIVMKNKPGSPLAIHYLLLRGPFSEMEWKPQLHQFKFTDKCLESPYESLEVLNKLDVQKFFTSKRVNIRIYMFLNR